MIDLHLDEEAVAGLYGRSLMATTDYDDKALGALLDVAEAFATLDRAGIKTPLFPNELAYALFFDNSTRTKSAWAGASTRLGMNPVIVDGGSTQVSHGETAEETGAMIGMNSHAIGIRHDMILGQGRAFMCDVHKGINDYLKATNNDRQVPIVNLQCDLDHPTQILADYLWMREFFKGQIRGKKIAMTWAYSPSYAKPLSVPQGLITLMTRMGAEVVLAHPEGYDLLPETIETSKKQAEASGGSFRITNSMDDAFKGADIVYPKSWGIMSLMQERVGANKEQMKDIEQRALAENARHKDWICDEKRMAETNDALYLHCLPADIGAEVSHGVLNKFRVPLAREANKKMYVVMAMIATCKDKNLVKKLLDFAK